MEKLELLDYFAGQCLAGFMSIEMNTEGLTQSFKQAKAQGFEATTVEGMFAWYAYTFAEAMIEERKRRGLK